MRSGLHVRAKVVDAQGHAIPGAAIRATFALSHPLWPPPSPGHPKDRDVVSIERWTDANGIAELGWLPRGDTEVSVDHAAFAPARVTAPTYDDGQIDVTLTTPAAVEVAVATPDSEVERLHGAVIELVALDADGAAPTHTAQWSAGSTRLLATPGRHRLRLVRPRTLVARDTIDLGSLSSSVAAPDVLAESVVELQRGANQVTLRVDTLASPTDLLVSVHPSSEARQVTVALTPIASFRARPLHGPRYIELPMQTARLGLRGLADVRHVVEVLDRTGRLLWWSIVTPGAGRSVPVDLTRPTCAAREIGPQGHLVATTPGGEPLPWIRLPLADTVRSIPDGDYLLEPQSRRLAVSAGRIR